MELVKALTRTMNSITVCATIHSPSPQTFDLFDKVIILLSGRIVYFGNNGEYSLPNRPPCTQSAEGANVIVLALLVEAADSAVCMPGDLWLLVMSNILYTHLPVQDPCRKLYIPHPRSLQHPNPS